MLADPFFWLAIINMVVGFSLAFLCRSVQKMLNGSLDREKEWSKLFQDLGAVNARNQETIDELQNIIDSKLSKIESEHQHAIDEVAVIRRMYYN